MAIAHDLSGKKFGRWTALRRDTLKRRCAWICQCECGNQKSVESSSLTCGGSKSCGCLGVDANRKRLTTHGKSRTKTHMIWWTMIQRCRNKSVPCFSRYGGRGITVCARWQKYENFLEDMGECPPGRSIDRIDGNGNYEPTNCQWATPKEQARNKKRTRLFEYNGKTMTLPEISSETNIPYSRLYRRICILKMSLADAMSISRVNKPRSASA